MLNECAERMGTTRANVITRGIEAVHRELEEAE
nr:MAG TPA: TraY domain [Caudoviricetes sp.]